MVLELTLLDSPTALSVTLFYILSDRDVLSKLYAELLTHIPEANVVPPPTTLEPLPYLISLFPPFLPPPPQRLADLLSKFSCIIRKARNLTPQPQRRYSRRSPPFLRRQHPATTHRPNCPDLPNLAIIHLLLLLALSCHQRRGHQRWHQIIHHPTRHPYRHDICPNPPQPDPLPFAAGISPRALAQTGWAEAG